jgi:hypothetical protein
LSDRLGTGPIRDEICPFCCLPIQYEINTRARSVAITCKCCGTYQLTGDAETVLSHWNYSEQKWAAASFQIRRVSDRAGPPLTKEMLKEILANAELPLPTDALDEIVIWLATHSRWPGDSFHIRDPEYRAIFGAFDAEVFDAYLNWLLETGWISGIDVGSMEGAAIQDARLTPAGWDHFRELTTTGLGSRHAFMAMQFGEPGLDSVVQEYFLPAVKSAGFDLRRVIDNQGAGLIDDQMRVAIRTSRFVVCDLTHGNRGAYWEAGFAEGLGKPVIYTCRAEEFHSMDPAKRPHFDTGHLNTIPWDPSNLQSAADRLKAMVRATLPGEAKLED